MSPLNAAICTTISYTLWVEWYYLKNNYLTLRSKVKVPRRSLWYATHRLVVMHPHTKYHWPYQISLTYLEKQKCYGPDKKYLTLRSKSHEGHYGMRHTALWSCTHVPNIIDLSGKTNKRLPGACNRWHGSKLLSITTQLHCGGHLGGRAWLLDTILEEDHPMTIPSKFGSNWATGSRQDGFCVNFP